jgi:hypothetical protein
MAGFVVSLKGLPSTYNKDLQEDKEPLFDTVDHVLNSIKIAEGLISTMTVHGDRMRQALSMDVMATDLADYLVRKGVRPFFGPHAVIYFTLVFPSNRCHSVRPTMFRAGQSLWQKRGIVSWISFRWKISRVCTPSLVTMCTPCSTSKRA